MGTGRRTPLVEELKAADPLISVGVLSADMMDLRGQIDEIEAAGVRILHFDVMDGCFCPMLTFGAPFVKAVKTGLLKDVHLMIEEPVDKIDAYVAAGADIVTVHVESTRHVHRALQRLAEMQNANDPERGIVRGVALNPGTPIETVRPLLDEVNFVMLLAVNPGWGGQKFAASTEARLDALGKMISDAQHDILIGVDGGIKKENIGAVAAMGAQIIVTGSAVFDGKDPAGNAAFMMDEAGKGAGRRTS
ncbi:MAG: ribulose-phosphate 3-epimerase [Planctomycetes bacterium]|nr:ribulose-phosphate 3-epimerase [Planctomycetota bacterium]